MREVIESARFLGGVAGVWAVLVTFGFAAFHIPSESMQPSLEVGDRVLVSKWAYGYSRHSLPLNLGYLIPCEGDECDRPILQWAEPQRGDVIVFRDDNGTATLRDNKNLIKRVIGLPGDRIQLIDDRLYINGELVEREFVEARNYRANDNIRGEHPSALYTEHLPGGVAHSIYERDAGGRYQNYGERIVPEGHVFVMGDNRDRSIDSRDDGALGFVPYSQVIGRAETVIFTTANCREEPGLHCPTGRVWRGL
jgi:signal peptidase I